MSEKTENPVTPAPIKIDSPLKALALLDELCGRSPLDRASHIVVQQAVEMVRSELVLAEAARTGKETKENLT